MFDYSFMWSSLVLVVVRMWVKNFINHLDEIIINIHYIINFNEFTMYLMIDNKLITNIMDSFKGK
jgi:hypothetical protein